MSYLDDANLVVPIGRLDLHQHLLPARPSSQAGEWAFKQSWSYRQQYVNNQLVMYVQPALACFDSCEPSIYPIFEAS